MSELNENNEMYIMKQLKALTEENIKMKEKINELEEKLKEVNEIASLSSEYVSSEEKARIQEEKEMHEANEAAFLR